MAEWLKAAVLKTVNGVTRSGVRIPLPPPGIKTTSFAPKLLWFVPVTEFESRNFSNGSRSDIRNSLPFQEASFSTNRSNRRCSAPKASGNSSADWLVCSIAPAARAEACSPRRSRSRAESLFALAESRQLCGRT